jgi:hypothetical protein
VSESLPISLFFLLSVFPECQAYKQFKPGEIWKENKSMHFNANGGEILFNIGIDARKT